MRNPARHPELVSGSSSLPIISAIHVRSDAETSSA
jgi:hypothetical protein